MDRLRQTHYGGAIMISKQIVIIGAGPAGLAAAVAAKRAGVSEDEILVLERDSVPGGILNQCIHAGFGLARFGEELTGPEYAGRFIDEAKNENINIVTDAMVLSVTEDKLVTFVSPKLGYTSVKANAVILAMGCRERTRGALNIPGFRPSGVFTAGTAQRYVNIEGYMPGKRVVILGSGDIGLIMARRMTLEGAKVLCVAEIMPYSGGLARNIVQCLDDFNIPLLLSHTVVDIKGRERVEGVTIAAVDEANGRKVIPGTEQYFECDTLLLSVGLIPENELTRGAGVEIDPMTSGASVNQRRETAIPGIFSCGNVLHVHDLVDYVSGEAEIAGDAAAKYVLGQLPATAKQIKMKAGAGVRYTVPQRIDASANEDDVTVYFRSSGIIRGAKITLTSKDGMVLAEKKKPVVTPGEMETVKLSGAKLAELDADELTLSVEAIN